ncbi:hypothetical protein RN001_012342 [Aquatica leii]|uniref:Ubiquitin-like modifier-activating enzyme ATG7 n=1 Tax=Aquatica leii TaxID=1421715 RepID=A0AAN7NYD0_9COLE|nr:hypothetical protein RN001_012342 [Aquatica leii]
MTSTQEKVLEYFPFNSSVNPSFWHKLTEIKLDIDKLNETNRHIWGYYSNLTNHCKASLFEVDSTSFNVNNGCQNMFLPIRGVLMNKNTIDLFKDCDKNKLVQNEGFKLWEYYRNGEALQDPSLLNFFLILSFADLKKYHYYYWFCFLAPTKINLSLVKKILITDLFSIDKINLLFKDYTLLDVKQKTFFIIKNGENKLEVQPLSVIKDFNTSTNLKDYYFAFSDPSALPDHPGWPMRNYIAFLLYNCPFFQGSVINFVSFRLNRAGGELSCSNSCIFTVILPKINFDDLMNGDTTWIGWEKNERGKFGPRLSNMKNSIDPKCLAETAVDLNLKLIKWQLLPNIDLEKVKLTKCLLLGSGTLGCSVARCLLGWGVRNITFLDNSIVSFSNPVRQSLFTYENCLENKSKAIAAAENLEKVFPGVNTKGVDLSIPMPGHPVGESLLLQTKESVEILTELISNHDIIFLLMDSRESRWLPTLLGNYYKKIVINAALGFDTYLVMRHGCNSGDSIEETPGTSTEGYKAIPGNNLGCYFCNDVTAPGDSLSQRTLDQQCTVTRPGISSIAGALAVELAISILQHRNGANAAAFYRANNYDFGENYGPEESLLGIVPHSIRGFLSSYSHVLPATEKYKQCVACSDVILQEYATNGFEFLLKVFNSSKYLEELTGLADIQNEIGNLEVWDLEEMEESD